MRISALELLRYGCFTEAGFTLGASTPDLHLIYGANEAGKSTALNAIEDLLFGFEGRDTPFAFRHRMPDLRIGAAIHNAREALEFRRRKGIKNTILDTEEQPLNDSVLIPFLHGVDRALFKRMFSLDHVRLREGGQEILDEKGELGRTLLSASTGLSGLPKELERLESDADALWGPRFSASRVYSVAEKALKEAGQSLKETTVLTREWKAAQNELEVATADYDKSKEEFERAEKERGRLERIRRVLPHLSRCRELADQIAEKGPAANLPADAAKTLLAAQAEGNEADVKIRSFNSQVEEIQRKVDEIVIDRRLLEHAAEIERLNKRREVVNDRLTGLPKRISEAAVHEKKLRALLADVGRQDIDGRFPSRLALDHIRALLDRKKATDLEQRTANKSVAELREKLASLRSRLEDRPVRDAGPMLPATIREALRGGGLDQQIAETALELKRSRERLEASCAALSLWDGTPEELARLRVPGKAAVESFAGRAVELQEDRRRLDEKLREAAGELAEAKLRRDQTVRDERAVSLEELTESRAARDRIWQGIRSRNTNGEAAPAEELEAFESKVSEADKTADRRFDGAEASARLTGIDQRLERLHAERERLENRSSELAEREQEFDREWRSLWVQTGIKPDSPRVMLPWLSQRDKLIESFTAYLDLERNLKEREDREQALRRQLADALEPLLESGTPLAGKSLGDLISQAEAVNERIAREASARQDLERQIEERADELRVREGERDQAAADSAQWRREWEAAVNDAGLPADWTVDKIRGSLSVFAEIRETGAQLRDLRESRIKAMERDIERFSSEARELAAKASPGLEAGDSLAAAAELHRRLSEENRKTDQRNSLIERLEQLTNHLREAKQVRDEAAARIQPLLGIAKVEDPSELQEEIDRAEDLRKLHGQQDQSHKDLTQAGDGKTFDQLADECGGADPDEVRARLGSLTEQIRVLNGLLQDLANRKQRAEEGVAKIKGSADAAAAEANRQQALAEMSEAAERYVRLKSSAVILRRAIDLYRQERQGPLLDRAGGLFRTLTLNRFEKLTVRYDEKDQPHVAGVRPDGEQVAVEGMSDGSVDQLYLALRTASLELYLEKTQALMPFVADDLFINFDDGRAAAGFRVLASLAQRTQVLFFTHHKHLLEIANETLPAVARLDLDRPVS